MKQCSFNLSDTLLKIRALAIDIAKQEWLELGYLIDKILPSPLNPFFLLPIATGIGCKGEINKLIDTAAVIVLIDISLTMIDDCADQDNPSSLDHTIGVGRTINYAMALNTLATRELFNSQFRNQNLNPLTNFYFHSFLKVCQGQDYDMHKKIQSLEEYQELVKLKTITAYEFASVAGAIVSMHTEESVIALCSQCGGHLGWMTQILDDIESLWFPEVENMREIEKKTFPVIIGLNTDHPYAKTLEYLFQQKEYDRIYICKLLDKMDVRTRLMNIALDHRDEAIKSLVGLPNPEGSNILKLWLDWQLQKGENLLGFGA